MTLGGAFDYDARVTVNFAEDISFADAAPMLDSLAAAGVFSVRSNRVGSAGPMSEGTAEVALVIQVALGVGIGAFAKKFMELLATDAYAATRRAIQAIAEKVRGPGTRAASALAVDVGIRFDFGPYFHEGEPVWTDDELIAMLTSAQRLLESVELGRLPIATWQAMDAFRTRPAVHWDPVTQQWLIGETVLALITSKRRETDA